jgi:osmotically inducible protein OsmC
VSLTKSDAGISISAVHLETRVTSPGADDATFQEAAEGAKNGCPVSQVLNATITLDAALVG